MRYIFISKHIHIYSGLLTAINCSNVKLAAKVTEVFSITKVLALVLIIITGIVYLCLGHTENISPENLMQVEGIGKCLNAKYKLCHNL